MPKEMPNPFLLRLPPQTSAPVKISNQPLVLDAWMIDNPMLMTRNFSIHLDHCLADRLQAAKEELRCRLPAEQQRTDFSISTLLEIILSEVLDDYDTNQEQSVLFKQVINRSEHINGAKTK